MKHEIEKLIWRKEQSLGLGDDEHLNHEQIGELMVEFARGECGRLVDCMAQRALANPVRIQKTDNGIMWVHDVMRARKGKGHDKASLYKYIGMEW